MSAGHLRVVVCGAGPAIDVARLIDAAHDRSWTASVTATAAALDLIDVAAVEQLTGSPVRTSHHDPSGGRRVLPPVDAVVVAPATFNTVVKLAVGVADTYPLVSVAELIGRGVPTVVVPFVNAALAARAPFRRAVAELRAEGVRVLSGAADGWEPHPPGTGDTRREGFPWRRAFQLAACEAPQDR